MLQTPHQQSPNNCNIIMAQQGYSEVSISVVMLIWPKGSLPLGMLHYTTRFSKLQRERRIRWNWWTQDMYLNFLYSPSDSNRDIPDITGPETATTGVVLIYDVFGFGPQILQVYMLFRTKGWRILCFFFFRSRSDSSSLNGIEILGSWYPRSRLLEAPVSCIHSWFLGRQPSRPELVPARHSREA